MKTLWLAALLVLGAAPARAYVCFNIGQCVRWNPPQAHLRLFLGPAGRALTNGTITYDQNAVLAAQTWNGVSSRFQFSWSVGGQFFDPCGARGPEHVCNNTGPAGDNPVFFASTLCGRGFGDVLAQTTTCYDTRTAEIVNSPVFFDGSQNWDAYDGPLRGTYDIRRVLTHEFGHVLGLVHPDDNGQSVQALMNRRISNLDRPQADDINGVNGIYSGGVPPSTAGPMDGNCSISREATPGWWVLGLLGLILWPLRRTDSKSPAASRLP